jgi:hypothetical protein
MQGFSCAEAGHVINLLPPQSITGGVVQVNPGFTLKNYKHASILILLGAEATQIAGTLQVFVAPTVSGTGIPIPFNYYFQAAGGAGNDVLSAIQNAPASGLTLAVGNAPANGLIVIEIDVNELEASTGALAGTALAGTLGQDSYVTLSIPSAAAANYAAVAVVLSGARNSYASSSSVTV